MRIAASLLLVAHAAFASNDFGKSFLETNAGKPGVKVLGGTYAIDGDAVRFAHMDEVPGATPESEDVLAAVGA